MIPAYVVMNGQVVYTIDVELPEEGIRYESDGDWVYYTFLVHRYRVRNFLTDEERQHLFKQCMILGGDFSVRKKSRSSIDGLREMRQVADES